MNIDYYSIKSRSVEFKDQLLSNLLVITKNNLKATNYSTSLTGKNNSG